MALPAIKNTVFNVETRKEAIKVLAQGASAALHEHTTNPLIYHAASELIIRDDRGQKTDIRALGLPHQVLAEVANELHQVGISAFVSSQIIDALEGYAVGLGADFAREAQAKPLYARIVVTDRKPDDIPDCELVQATLIDGQRRVGEGVSQRVMQSTIYGTRTSMTKEMNLDEMFAASKKKWLLIYYGSPSNETYKGLDSVDVSLINLMQGLGDKLPENVLEDIQEKLKAGALSQTHIEIIEEFAGIEKLLEPYSDGETLPPDVQSELSALISGLSDKIAVVENNAATFRNALSLIIEKQNISFTLPSASNDEHFIAPEMVGILVALESISQSEGLSLETQKELIELLADIKTEANETGEALNVSLDKIVSVLVRTAAAETVPLPLFQSISALLPEIIQIRDQRTNISPIPQSDMLALVELVQAISQAVKKEQEAGHTAPAQITDSLNIIDKMIEGKSSEQAAKLLVDAIKNSSSDQFAVAVQNLVVSLAQPDIQAFKVIAPNFAFKHANIIQAAATSILIRTAEAQLSGIGPTGHINPLITLPAMEPAEIKAVLQVLKSEGISGLLKKDADVTISAAVRDAIEQMGRTNPQVMEAVLTGAIIREIEGKVSGGLSKNAPSIGLNIQPRELNQILEVVKAGGVTALLQPQNQSFMSPYAKQVVEQFVQKNPAAVEAIAAISMIKEIEKAGGGGSHHVTPAERNLIIQAIQSGGLTALAEANLSERLTAPAKEYVAKLVVEAFGKPNVRMEPPIIAEIRKAYIADNYTPSHAQVMQNGAQKPLSSSFNTDKAQQDYSIASTLSKVLSQPSQELSAKDYERNLKILDLVTSTVSSQPNESPKEAIAKLIKSPEGIATADAILDILKAQPTEYLSVQEQKSVMEIKRVVLEAKVERGIADNNQLSANIKADIVAFLRTASSTDKSDNATLSLNKVRDILQRAGSAIPDDFKELQNAVEQKVKIEKEQPKPTSSTIFTQTDAFTQGKVVSKPESHIFRKPEAHADTVQKTPEKKASKPDDTSKQTEIKPDVEVSCPMGKNVCCCGDAFKAAAETKSLFQRLRGAVSGAFKGKENVKQTLSDRNAIDAAFDDALSPK